MQGEEVEGRGGFGRSGRYREREKAEGSQRNDREHGENKEDGESRERGTGLLSGVVLSDQQTG